MADNSQASSFIKDFVAHSKAQKDKLVPVWHESLQNFLVQTDHDAKLAQDPAYPYLDRNNNSSIQLKDPETKQVIDTLLSKYMIALFGQSPYIAAKKRGREDATEASTVTRLLDYALSREGHYRTIQTSLQDCLIFGTGIIELDWEYTERLQTVRDIEMFGGQEFRQEARMVLPVYDDIRLRNVDVMDFFPDPGTDTLRDMVGAAKRFKVTSFDALKRAQRGQYNMAATRAAIASIPSESPRTGPRTPNWRRERPEPNESFSGFKVMEGYEYWGEVPWSNEDGERWRVITVINGHVVRDIPWPLDDHRLPFYDLAISPIQGRFWGIGAAESSRYQQDFIDFLMMMVADSVVRSVHPPILHNMDDEMDINQLMSWSPDVPIASSSPNDIRTMPYSANLQGGFALFSQIKNSIREGTGATGAVQGHGLGINRASATEADRTFQAALSRPELGARYLEAECLPPLGMGILKRYQQELETTEELVDRVGEMPEPVRLADIQADFDVQFIGSRNHESLQKRIASIDRIIQLGQIPQIANLIPWEEVAIQTLEGFGFHGLAEKIADPRKVMQNLMVAQLAGGNAGQLNNGNGAVTSAPSADTSLAQQAGNVIPFER